MVFKMEKGMDDIFHCDDCGRCTYYMDHHCGFMGNCIGKKNVWGFYLYIGGIILCAFLGYFSIFMVHHVCE